MDDLQGVRVAGPLASYARGFAGELARLGYRSGPAQKQLQLAVQLSGWLAAASLNAADLDAAAIGAYLTARRAAGYGEFVTPRALAPLLGYLRRLRVALLPEAPVPQTLAEELLDGYRCWLLAERGLRLTVARGYLNAVRPFVTAHATLGLSGLRELAAADVTAFLLAESRRHLSTLRPDALPSRPDPQRLPETQSGGSGAPSP